MLSRTSGFLERRASYVPPQFNTVWSNTTNHWCFHQGQNNKQCNFELVYILRQCMIHCELSSIRVQMTHYLWCAIPKKWCHLFLQTNWWGTSFTTAALSWLDSKLNLFRKFLFLFLLISFFFFYLIEISISCINR